MKEVNWSKKVYRGVEDNSPLVPKEPGNAVFKQTYRGNPVEPTPLIERAQTPSAATSEVKPNAFARG